MDLDRQVTVTQLRKKGKPSLYISYSYLNVDICLCVLFYTVNSLKAGIYRSNLRSHTNVLIGTQVLI